MPEKRSRYSSRNPEPLDYPPASGYLAGMRPLYHPPLEEITVQGILYALSDPVRVRIFMQLRPEADGAQNCSAFLKVGDVELPKSSLSQHFKILREAGLIRSERKGVELKNYSRCSELKKTFAPMIQTIVKAYAEETSRHAKR